MSRPGAGLARPLAVAVVLAAIVAPVHAQKVKNRIPRDQVPGWVDEAISFPVGPTDADIVWMLLEETIEPLTDGGVRYVQRRVGKVLRRPGLEAVASMSTIYENGDQVRSVKAWTILPDGTARKTRPEARAGDILDLPFVPSGSVYEATRELRAMAPGVVIGAFVAHEFEIVREFDPGAAPFLFGSADEPTVLSRLTLRIPEGWLWDATTYRGSAVELEREEGLLSYVARNLAPLPHEEMRPPIDELLPLVWVRWWTPDGQRGFADWGAVGRWFQQLTSPVLDALGGSVAVGERLRPSEPGLLLDSIAEAFAFVASEVRYVSIQIGIGGFRPHTPAEVFSNRYGDCKDKTFLLRSLVGGWGLETYPVFVLTRDEGEVYEEVPTPGMFNHAIAAVALPDGVGDGLWPVVEIPDLGRLLLMDGTVRRGDAWNLPASVQGTTALLVEPEGGRLIELPVQPPEAAFLDTRVEVVMLDDGRLDGAVVLRKYGGVRATHARSYLSGMDEAERLQAIQSDIQQAFPGVGVVDYRIDGLEERAKPVVETIRLAGGRIGKRLQELLIIEPGRTTQPLFDGMLPPPPRAWDLRLPFRTRLDAEVRLTTPAGWVPERLPPGLELSTDEVETESRWTVEDGEIVLRSRTTLQTNHVPQPRYEAFRETMMRLEAERLTAIVLVPQ